MRTAVIYYSLDGNTRLAATKLAERLNADIFEVCTTKPYPRRGFAKILKGGKDALFGALPQIKVPNVDPSIYDAVVLAFPLWAGKVAAPINSALQKLDFGSARVALMISSASGDLGTCENDVTKKLGRQQGSIATVGLKNPKKMSEAELSNKIEELVARVQPSSGGGAF